MPTHIINIPGVGQVAFPDTMSDAEIAAASKRLHDQASGEEGPGLLGSTWETAKHLGSAALEAIGRPGELVSGTVAGALAPERDLTRGLRAFVEPLVGSTQEESFGKVLQEQTPEFAKAHPWLTTAAGLGADIVLDPINLLGGAGFVRKGLIKGAEAVGAGKAAETALLAPTRAWQGAVVPKLEQATYKAAQALPLPAFVKEQAALRSIGKGASGFSLPELKSITQGKIAGDVERSLGQHADNLKVLQELPPEQLDLIGRTISQPMTADSQALLQDPTFARAVQAARDVQHAQYLNDTRTFEEAIAKAAQDTGVSPLEFRRQFREQALSELSPDTLNKFKALNPKLTEAQAVNQLVENKLREAFAPGGTPLMEAVEPLAVRSKFAKPVAKGLAGLSPEDQQRLQQQLLTHMDDLGQLSKAAYTGLSPELSKVLQLLDKGTSVVQDGVLTRTANLKSLHFVPDAEGIPQAFVSTELPNYMFQTSRGGGLPLKSALKTGFGPGKERSLTWAEHEARGGITNAADVLLRRITASAVSKANRELVQRVAQDFGTTVKQPGFRALSASKIKELPEDFQLLLKGKYVPDAVANELEKVTARIYDPKQAEGLLNVSQKLWKTFVTAGNLPGHQLVNLTGNVLNMHAIGMDPLQIGKQYVKAFASIVRGRPNKYLQEFKDLGLGASGEASEFRNLVPTLKTEAAQRMTAGSATIGGKTYQVNPLNPDAAYYAALRNINQHLIEDPGKLAVYQWARESGKTADQAALLVKQALFDYNDLTDFEKQYLRHVVPFYTWTRKNVPLQLATLAKRPGRLANQKRLIEAADQLANLEAEQPLEGRPDYTQGQEFFRVPGTERTVAAARFPLFDINWLNAADLAQRGAFQLNPLYRIPIELGLGRRLGTDQQISDTRITEPNALQRLTGLGTFETAQGPKTTGLTRYLADQIPLPAGAATRTLAAMPENEGEAQDVSSLQQLLLRMGGVSPITITPQQQLRQRQQQLAQRRAQLQMERLRNPNGQD